MPANNIDSSVETDKRKVNFTKGEVNEFKFYPDNPVSETHKKNFAIKEPSKFYDPCAESSKMSIKCLELNNFDRTMCSEYFAAYRECKKQWIKQRREDRASGNGW